MGLGPGLSELVPETSHRGAGVDSNPGHRPQCPIPKVRDAEEGRMDGRTDGRTNDSRKQGRWGRGSQGMGAGRRGAHAG